MASGSTGWKNIEPGTKIVMRVIFEQLGISFGSYTCHLCGALNHLASLGMWGKRPVDGSVDWFVPGIRLCKCISHRKVMHAKEDFRSRSKTKALSIDAMLRMMTLTQKLGTPYATSVSHKLYVSLCLSIITFLMS